MLVLGISLYWLVSILCLIFFHGENRLLSAFYPILVGYEEVWGLKRKNSQIKPLYFQIFLRIVIDILIVLVVILFLLLAGPFLYLWKVRQNRMESAKREQEQKQFEAGELEKAVQSRLAENERRMSVARWWFESNPPILYYNTMAGITAVLTPTAFAEACVATERAIWNETWSPAEVFIPHRNTVLFGTSSGRNTVQSKSSCWLEAYWVTDLHDVARKWNVILEHKREVFVPLVSESPLMYREQISYLRKMENLREVEALLILSQLPKEIQPAY